MYGAMGRGLILACGLLLFALIGGPVCQAAADPFLDSEQKVLASDGASGDQFGYSVAISGERAIIGAYSEDFFRGAAYIYELSPTGWVQVQKLTAADLNDYDYFGWSVAISGDVAVIGAYGDDERANDAGAAYVFKRGASTWSQVAKLTLPDDPENPDAHAMDYFGWSVAVSIDTALVGARLSDDINNGINSGSVAVFRYSAITETWPQTTLLLADDGLDYDMFGASVALSENTAVIGAYGNDAKGPQAGSAYIFQRSGDIWTQSRILTPLEVNDSDFFGWSVSISGDLAVVGAYQDDAGGMGNGSAYIFHRDQGGLENWGKVKKLNGGWGGQFGYAVAISGDLAIIGAPADMELGPAGLASIYQRNEGGVNNWGLLKKFTPSDVAMYDNFAQSVAVSGLAFLLGSCGDDDRGSNAGAAYFYRQPGNLLLPTVYMNFYHEGLETGTQLFPFNTLAEGLANLADSGTIRLMNGSITNETVRLTRKMRLDGINGGGRIGVIY